MTVGMLQQKYDKIFNDAYDRCNKSIDNAITMYNRKMIKLRKLKQYTTIDEDASSVNSLTEELNDMIEKSLQMFDEAASIKLAGDEYAGFCWNKIKDELLMKLTSFIGVNYAKACVNSNRLLARPKRWWHT